MAGTTDPGDPFGGCLNGQYSWDYDGINVPWGDLVAANQRTVIFGRKVDQGFPQRYDTALKVSRQPGVWPCAWGNWWDPACAPIAIPARPPIIVAPPVSPEVPDWLDPFIPPNVQPVISPAPIWVIPHIRPNPWRSPLEQSESGNEVGPWYRPGVGGPVVDPAAEVPDVVVEPSGEVVVLPPTGNDTPAPPGEKTKEKKIRTKKSVAIRIIAGVAGLATEALDFVNGLYYALPYQYRPGYVKIRTRDGREIYVRRWRATQAQRIAAVYEHFDKINLNDAVYNLSTNELQDRGLGRLSRASQRAQRRLGEQGLSHRPVSWQAGPADTFFIENLGAFR